LYLREGKGREARGDYMMRNSITCTLHHVIRATKSRSVRWAGHVAWVGEMRKAYN